ncbi:hypothetical protein [Empedobacter brevis]|uniref:hypothetical protein n=1 Tax=Empedobacter brevis TaxID=247 RepID=UPI00289F55D2|nr:hypothetical protein [Empedobacter brevis]
MSFKINLTKIIMYTFICVPVVSVLGIFIYLEIESRKSSMDILPKGYERDVNENIFLSLNIINTEENDSLYTFTTISGDTQNSNLFFSKYYKKEGFKFEIQKGNSNDFKKVRKHDHDFFKDNSTPNGIFNQNFVPLLNTMVLKVENYKKISSSLYLCDSRYFFMILNNQYTTLGIFKNRKIYIQLIDRKDYFLLSIFSSDSEKELDLFNKVIKTD